MPFDTRGNIIEWSHWKRLVDILRHFDMVGNIIEWSHWKHLVDILRHFDMRGNIIEWRLETFGRYFTPF